MADVRINEITTTETGVDTDDYFAIDGVTQGTRKALVNKFFGTEVVKVAQESDFGTPSGGVITLLRFRHYILTEEVTITNRLALPADGPVEISSSNWGRNTLEVTIGANDFISSTDAIGIYMHNIVINCTDGLATMFNLVSTQTANPRSYFITSGIDASTNWASLGRIEGFKQGNLRDMDFFNFDDGITFDNNDKIVANNINFESDSSSAITDITIEGSGDVITLNEIQFSRSDNTTALSIDSGSSYADGKVINCDYTASTGSVFTDPTGLDRTDPNWNMSDNGDAKDSRNVAQTYLTSSQTITVSASSTFYEVGGTAFLDKLCERFTCGTDGVVTYDGVGSIDVKVTCVATIEKVGGSSDELEGRIGKNWTGGSGGDVASGVSTKNSDPTSVTIQTLLEIDNGDDIRPIFANNDGTSNITVDISNMIIIEV